MCRAEHTRTERKKSNREHRVTDFGPCACSSSCSPRAREPEWRGRSCCNGASGREGSCWGSPEGETTTRCLRRRTGQLQLKQSLSSAFRQCSTTPVASLELCGGRRACAMVPIRGLGTRGRLACRLPSQPGWREAPRPSLHSGRCPEVRSTFAAPTGGLDADCREWRGSLQWRGRWSTPRRARAAGAAQQAECMGGRSIALRRPTLTIGYRRLL